MERKGQQLKVLGLSEVARGDFIPTAGDDARRSGGGSQVESRHGEQRAGVRRAEGPQRSRG